MATTYWKSTKAALDAITGATGDRAAVTESGVTTIYYWSGSAWTLSTINITDLTVVTAVTNFPAAIKGQEFLVVGSGWLGGAAGIGLHVVDGDILKCVTTTVAGTYAEVINYWNHIPHMVYKPDGYRYVEMASNTVAPTGITNGYYFLNNVMYKVENGVHSVVEAA